MNFKIFILFLLIIPSFIYIANAENIGYNNPQLITNVMDQSNKSLTIAERDILLFDIIPKENMTAKYNLIIQHEAWIINNDSHPKNVTIYTSFSRRYEEGMDNYTRFGNNASVQQGIAPNIQDYFFPDKIKLLGKPTIEIFDDEVNYTWYNITIEPKEAVIIKYSNYYGNGSNIYNTTDIYLPNALITRSYTKSSSNNFISFIINCTMKNTANLRLQAPEIDFFFPEKNDEGAWLIKPSNISVNPSSHADVLGGVGYIDGTGNMKVGHLFSSHFPKYIDANDQVNLLININGTIENAGTILPTIEISYAAYEDPYNISGKTTRIWPATHVISKDEMNITNFYYYEVCEVIPENNHLVVSPAVDAGNLTPKPGVATLAISSLIILLIMGILAHYIGKK
jgi:hypothetical protein